MNIITVKQSFYEAVNINLSSLQEILPDVTHFHKWDEPKWIKYCKKHHFHPIKDAYGKYYEQYLRLCSEGLVED